MIEVMQGLPEGALGFVARGRVMGAEYRALKTPRIEAAFANHRKLRVLWLIGMTSGVSRRARCGRTLRLACATGAAGSALRW
jgi:hypothetical protein